MKQRMYYSHDRTCRKCKHRFDWNYCRNCENHIYFEKITAIPFRPSSRQEELESQLYCTWEFLDVIEKMFPDEFEEAYHNYNIEVGKELPITKETWNNILGNV